MQGTLVDMYWKNISNLTCASKSLHLEQARIVVEQGCQARLTRNLSHELPVLDLICTKNYTVRSTPMESRNDDQTADVYSFRI